MSRCYDPLARRPRSLFPLLFLALLLFPVFAAATPCVVPDAGGTVSLPPTPGCGYLSPTDVHMIINGLPAGTTIRLGAEHRDFFNVVQAPDPTGGEQENFQSALILHLQGTGTLAGYSSTKSIQTQCQVHTNPRTLGTTVQSFDTDMQMIQGQLPPGDPDFDLLRITAGTNFGMPSPGHTTLTKLSGPNWNVDSFFDITYRIDFIGHPGGPFGGMSGSTTATIRMATGQPMPTQGACVVPNSGGGTVSLPPAGCGYVSPNDLHMMINGLPPGTQLVLAASHEKFTNITHTPDAAGGETENFGSGLALTISGTGSLSTFHRVVSVPTQCQVHTNPRSLGSIVQSFDTDMQMIQGQLPAGDPDFDLLRVTAGSNFGMPSPGHTTLTLKSDGNWNIDSFFDITYRIDFVGHPGGGLSGMSGSTTGTIRMGTGVTAPPPAGPCQLAANADGSVDLPPAGCGYLSPSDVHLMIDGLPAGTQLHIAAQHAQFFNVVRDTGGTLGGKRERFGSVLVLQMTGTGGLQLLNPTKTMQIQCQSSTAQDAPGKNSQSFDTQMDNLQGQLPPGDPDFDLLRITAGTGFGLPSPGHTTLTRAPDSGGPPSYNLDSFFDITYRIDFVGHPGGPLSGMSGSTTGTIRMESGQPTLVSVPAGGKPVASTVQLTNSPNPYSSGTSIQYRLPQSAAVRVQVYDAAGQRVRDLTDAFLPAGPHAVLWDGRSDSGRRLGSGTYFVKLSVDGALVASKKAVLIR